MKKLLKQINAAVPTILLAAGTLTISGGVAMISIPAGLIVGGCLIIAAGVLMILGGAAK